jgi:ATP-dependent Zn protease
VRGKKVKAHHEAGHAVVARVLDVDVQHVSLPVGDDGAVAETRSALHQVGDKTPSAQIAAAEKDAKVALAGVIAQQWYRPLTEGQQRKAEQGPWRDDLSHANSLVAEILYFQKGRGMSDLLNEPERENTLSELAKSDEARSLFRRLWEETHALVQHNWSAVQRVADALLERRYLHREDIDAVIARRGRSKGVGINGRL